MRSLLLIILFLTSLVLFSGCSYCTAPSPRNNETIVSQDMVIIKGHVGVPNATVNIGASNLASIQGMVVAEPSTSLRTRPKCDPFACKSVSNTPVRIVKPSQSGWKAEPAESATTDENGDFTITIDKAIFDSDVPVFIAALAPDGKSPLLSIIPEDLVYLGTIELAIDRTTTAAAVMHCPGGMNPPPSGSYCWSDPHESTNIERLYAQIDLFFLYNPSTTTNLEEYLLALSKNPKFLETLNEILKENNIPEVSATNPEGFKPITLENAHNLEGMGRVFTEPTVTTTKPKVTTTPQTTLTATTLDMSTGARLTIYSGWYQDTEAFKRHIQIETAEQVYIQPLVRDYSLSGVPLDERGAYKRQRTMWCYAVNNPLSQSLRGTCDDIIWYFDNDNLFPEDSYCNGDINLGGYDYDPATKETIFQLSPHVWCVSTGDTALQNLKVINVEKSGGGLTATFTASYIYDKDLPNSQKTRITKQLPTMTIRISPLRPMTEEEKDRLYNHNEWL